MSEGIMIIIASTIMSTIFIIAYEFLFKKILEDI